jgi:hypothetical protein
MPNWRIPDRLSVAVMTMGLIPPIHEGRGHRFIWVLGMLVLGIDNINIL